MNDLDVDGIAGADTLKSLGLIENGSGETGSPGKGILGPGNSGKKVRDLQEALVDNDFYPNINAESNGIDGVYGSNTENAVRRYQILNGLSVDGIAGPDTLSSLGLNGNGSGGSGGTANTFKSGDSGEDVRLLQEALVDNNFYPNIHAANNGVDGIYGADTEDAVQRYQDMNGLSVDGIAGPNTLDSLGISGGGSASPGRSGSYGDVLKPGDAGDAVRLLQETLVDNNFYPDIDASDNGVDGIYGTDTEDAVRRYQDMNGLSVDGIAGNDTLDSLGISNGKSGGGDSGEGSEGGADGSDGGEGKELPGGDFSDLSISQMFIPSLNYNRPGYQMNPEFITIHETANTAPGATASMHANYVKNPSTRESWHFTVDDKLVVYQHLPLFESGYHAGDGSGNGNRKSIGIELCVNSGGDFSQTRRNASALVKNLMNLYNIPIDNVVPHHHWSGKNCPANLLPQFDQFRDQILNSEFSSKTNYTLSSSFADIDESLYYDSDVPATFNYSQSYDILVGPLRGRLDGTIIVGEPKESYWSISSKNVFHGIEYTDIINALAKEVVEYGLPGNSDANEVRKQINSIFGDTFAKDVEMRMITFPFSCVKIKCFKTI